MAIDRTMDDQEDDSDVAIPIEHIAKVWAMLYDCDYSYLKDAPAYEESPESRPLDTGSIEPENPWPVPPKDRRPPGK
jgi:hypothetical protein